MTITFNKALVIVFITAFFLGWFALPIIIGASPAALLLVILAAIVLLCRLLGRADAIVVVIGIVVGVIVDLLAPQLSSSAVAGELLVRAFLSLWLVYTV